MLPGVIPFDTFDRAAISNYEDKLLVARSLAAEVQSGEVIGAGSGSTAFLTVHAIAERVVTGDLENVTLIPTSIEVQLTIAGLGLPAVIVQEGGYLQDDLGANLTSFLSGYLDA